MTRSARNQASPVRSGGPLRRSHWPLQDAKAHFSELVRRVQTDGPQHVTVHGIEAVVLMSADEFHRLKGDRTGQALVAALGTSPHSKVRLEPKRGQMPVRPVEL